MTRQSAVQGGQRRQQHRGMVPIHLPWLAHNRVDGHDTVQLPGTAISSYIITCSLDGHSRRASPSVCASCSIRSSRHRESWGSVLSACRTISWSCTKAASSPLKRKPLPCWPDRGSLPKKKLSLPMPLGNLFVREPLALCAGYTF